MTRADQKKKKNRTDRRKDTLIQTLDIIEAIQQTLVDVPARRLYLSEPVDDAVVRKLLAGLHRLDDLSTEDITLVINSPGGSSYDGMALVDAIAGARSHVIAIGTGHVMSAAVAVLQAADQRFLTPFCRLMIHNGSWYLGDAHSSVVISSGKEMEASNRVYAQLLAARSGQSVEKIAELCARETFMSAGEALDYGLIDAILGPEGPILKEQK